VAWLLWHWQGRLLGLVLSTATFGIIGIIILHNKGYLEFYFNSKRAKFMLLFSIPLIPHTLSTWVMNGSDRFFIATMVGAGAVGLYSVGYAVGQVIQLFQHAFSQAWVPYLFQELKKEQIGVKKQIVKLIYLHHLVIITLAISLHFAAPYMLNIFVGKDFQESSQFVFWVAAGYAINGMYRMVIPFLNYAHKTHLAPIGSTVSAIANLSLNYFLIKHNGPIGAAQATFISFLILYIITFYFSYRSYKMPWLFWLAKNSE
jgi:O-antigen/teichoic acid export membrane protein